MIAKLRAGMMPPPGRERPGGDTLDRPRRDARATRRRGGAASSLNLADATFQRLNRAEYERSIRDLLTLEVDAGRWLPLDTKSANFDNIADAQTPSATLLDAYLDAASEISRLAVGDPKASVDLGHVQAAAPRVAVGPASKARRSGRAAAFRSRTTSRPTANTSSRSSLHAIPTGQLFGSDAPFDEKIEVSVNGERVALIDVDRWMSQADPNGMDLKTTPITRTRRRRSASPPRSCKTFDGPVNDNIAPIGHSIADTQIGSEHGITNMPHLRDLVVTGPYNPTGVSDTPSRRRIFTCRPTSPDEARPCAEKIVTTLGGAGVSPAARGERREGAHGASTTKGAKEGGFEVGIRTALEAILASPHFVFRFEETPAGAKPGDALRHQRHRPRVAPLVLPVGRRRLTSR